MNDPLSALFAGNNGSPAGYDLDALFGLPDSEPLPAGVYAVELVSGKIGASKSGKARYELRARVVEGEHAGRAIFDDWYLSKEAWWKTGPLLKKIGIDSADKMRREYPAGVLARVRLTVEENNGTTRNKLADIQLTGRKPPDNPTAPPTPPTPDPFAPSTGAPEGGDSADRDAGLMRVLHSGQTDPNNATGERGDAWEHPADRRLPADQVSFPFGANSDGPHGAGGERR